MYKFIYSGSINFLNIYCFTILLFALTIKLLRSSYSLYISNIFEGVQSDTNLPLGLLFYMVVLPFYSFQCPKRKCAQRQNELGCSYTGPLGQFLRNRSIRTSLRCSTKFLKPSLIVLGSIRSGLRNFVDCRFAPVSTQIGR